MHAGAMHAPPCCVLHCNVQGTVHVVAAKKTCTMHACRGMLLVLDGYIAPRAWRGGPPAYSAQWKMNGTTSCMLCARAHAWRDTAGLQRPTWRTVEVDETPFDLIQLVLPGRPLQLVGHGLQLNDGVLLLLHEEGVEAVEVLVQREAELLLFGGELTGAGSGGARPTLVRGPPGVACCVVARSGGVSALGEAERANVRISRERHAPASVSPCTVGVIAFIFFFSCL
jgi:hypothetical protein